MLAKKTYSSSHVTELHVDVKNFDSLPVVSSVSTVRRRSSNTNNEGLMEEIKQLKKTNKTLRQMNEDLKNEIQNYKQNFMPKPTGAVAEYFINLGKKLSKNKYDLSPDEENNIRAKQLREYAKILNLDPANISKLKGRTIRGTCRKIVSEMFPKVSQRLNKKVGSIPMEQLDAIRNFGRTMHPLEENILDGLLNNAIGNVFSASKYRKKKRT